MHSLFVVFQPISRQNPKNPSSILSVFLILVMLNISEFTDGVLLICLYFMHLIIISPQAFAYFCIDCLSGVLKG